MLGGVGKPVANALPKKSVIDAMSVNHPTMKKVP
jgi:hypothetical protein